MKTFNLYPTIKIEGLTINEKNDGNPIIEIKGNRMGFIAWLLDKLKFNSKKYSFQFFKNYILTVHGEEFYEKNSSSDIHSSSIGYASNKLYLMLSIISYLCGGFFFFVFLLNFLDGEFISEVLLVSIPILLLGFLCNWLSKKFSVIVLSFSTSFRSTIGVKVKLNTRGKKASRNEMLKMKELIFNAIDKNK